MFTNLKNRMSRALVLAVGPASLSVLMMSHSFAKVDSQLVRVPDDARNAAGVVMPAAWDVVADDDGPGLGGGYVNSASPRIIVCDGPGSSTPYAILPGLNSSEAEGPGGSGYVSAVSPSISVCDGPGSSTPYVLA